MIEKAILNFNDDFAPASITWHENSEDYIVEIPSEITRSDLIKLVDEIKRITEWSEQ